MSDEISPHLRRAQALERQQAGESKQAAALLADFVEQARALGIEPERLNARSYDGRSRYRTHTEGWYLKRDRTVAVGTDGSFYILAVPASITSIMPVTPLLSPVSGTAGFIGLVVSAGAVVSGTVGSVGFVVSSGTFSSSFTTES